jgi:LacI family trehalose operon transcriptional repressor
MRGQSDKVVAIIVTRLDSLSENLAVQTMLPAFYEQGYDPIMMESQFSPALVEEHLGMLARRNIDGVVLFGFTGMTKRCSPLARYAGAAGPRRPGFACLL